jgi:hypothetical protein
MATFEPSTPAPESAARDRRWRRAGVRAGCIVIAGFVGVVALVYFLGLGATAGVKVTPSKATTYVTGPLRADGAVDC